MRAKIGSVVAGITSPSDGMFAYTTTTPADTLYYYNGSAWVATSLTADITGITTAANSSMAGGATSGAPSLTVDVNNSTSATAVGADYVLISDTNDSNATKKALISDITALAGDITEVTAGTLLDGGGTTGAVTLNVDLSEASTSTSDADGDYFIVTDAANAQHKLTKANIALSGMNNDSGWTSNAGDVTGVTAGTNIDVSSATGPVPTVNLAIDAKYAKVLEEYKAKLKQFQKDTQDPWVLKWSYE